MHEKIIRLDMMAFEQAREHFEGVLKATLERGNFSHLAWDDFISLIWMNWNVVPRQKLWTLIGPFTNNSAQRTIMEEYYAGLLAAEERSLLLLLYAHNGSNELLQESNEVITSYIQEAIVVESSTVESIRGLVGLAE